MNDNIIDFKGKINDKISEDAMNVLQWLLDSLNEYNEINERDSLSCDLLAVTILGIALSKPYFEKYKDKCKSQNYFDFVKDVEQINKDIGLLYYSIEGAGR